MHKNLFLALHLFWKCILECLVKNISKDKIKKKQKQYLYSLRDTEALVVLSKAS